MNYFFTLKLAAKVVIISKKNKNWLKRLKIGRKAKIAIMAKIAELDKIAIFFDHFFYFMNHFADCGVIIARKGILLTLLKSQNHQNDDLFTARLSSERAFFVSLQKYLTKSSLTNFF